MLMDGDLGKVASLRCEGGTGKSRTVKRQLCRAEKESAVVVTPKQAAQKTGVSDSLVYEWCALGLLTHYRFGKPGRRGKILIDETELEAFLAKCKQPGRPHEAAPVLKHIKLN